MGSEAVSQGQGKGEEPGEEGRPKGKREGQAGGWGVCPISGDMGTRNRQEQGEGWVSRVVGKQSWLSGLWPNVPASPVTGSDRPGEQDCWLCGQVRGNI